MTSPFLHIVGDLKADRAQLEELLKNPLISWESKVDLVEDFCSYYVLYDSSKFDKYFLDW